MNVLQLCCFTNFWPDCEVESWDLRNGRDIFNIPDGYANNFDLVCAAPPCDQFTKANSHSWDQYPEHFIKIALRCFEICLQSKSKWFLEQPPGRIETFIPELSKFRTILWKSPSSNKEYVIYSNFLILQTTSSRYGRNPKKLQVNMTKKQREAWDPDLVNEIRVFV